jgi:hypothetical protein
MKVTVRVTLEADDDTPAVVHEVFTLARGALASDTLGLYLDEAKDLLCGVQSAIVEEQVRGALAAQVACPDYGKARRHNNAREIVVRSLFGTLRLLSPRWWHCSCAIHQTRTLPATGGWRPRDATACRRRPIVRRRWRTSRSCSDARRDPDSQSAHGVGALPGGDRRGRAGGVLLLEVPVATAQIRTSEQRVDVGRNSLRDAGSLEALQRAEVGRSMPRTAQLRRFRAPGGHRF